jgi:hypothetical protein
VLRTRVIESVKNVARPVRDEMIFRAVERHLSRRADRWKPPRPAAPEIIYHCTVQKAGSQWLRAVLADRTVRSASGLAMHPQLDSYGGTIRAAYPRGTVVPSLYIAFDQYAAIGKPDEYRTIYVVRDPFELVGSWYWSILRTHPLIDGPDGALARTRSELGSMTTTDGLSRSIELLGGVFHRMRSWADALPQPNVQLFRFEDLTADPRAGLVSLFEFLDVPLSSLQLDALARRYSIAEMRRRDTRFSGRGDSHYREPGQGRRIELAPEHERRLEEEVGDLRRAFGYG